MLELVNTKVQGIECEIQYNFEAQCPIKDETDKYWVEIKYTPYGSVVERDSIRDYLDSFEDKEVLAEDLCVRIYSRFAQIQNVRDVHVELGQVGMEPTLIVKKE